MNLLRALSVLLGSLLIPVAAQASAICPALTGADPTYLANDTAASMNCNTIITISSAGVATITYPNVNPYDGSDDNYVGVINNYSGTVSSLTLDGGGNDIFGFDGDGIDTFGIAGNSLDNTTYGGGDAYFTDYTAYTGTVNFIGGIAAGGSGYFSLEDAPAAGAFKPPVVSLTPEPSSLLLLGTGAIGLAGVIRRKLTT